MPTTIGWFDWGEFHYAFGYMLEHAPQPQIGSAWFGWEEISDLGIYPAAMDWLDWEEILDLGIPHNHGLVRLGRDLGSWNIPRNHGLARLGRVSLHGGEYLLRYTSPTQVGSAWFD